MRRLVLIALAAVSLLAGCAHNEPKDLAKFKAANPTSILVVPVVNQSVEVTAPDYFLSTVSVPLAERGYYVFPVNLVKRLLEDEGLSDANMVHSAPAQKVCNLFGSDSVLYVNIKEWNAKYMVLTTVVNVDLRYVIKDCKTGDTLWEHDQKMVYTPKNNSTGNPIGDLVVMAISAAVTKAAPNYVPLARQANLLAFYPDGVGIPIGPYAPLEASASAKQ
jgi:hypothetical protein